jgi:nitroimidazol reductase NimA-like FMN-containing flavoprotein (pyridoxamine 5'-phosphate oxidase superfamily)
MPFAEGMDAPFAADGLAVPAHALSIRLDRAESWSRIRGQSVGRLAVSIAGQPDIFPVNFLALDHGILIRTDTGSKLESIGANSLVAFEVDEIQAKKAWSVVIKGSAQRLTDGVELEAARQSPLWTWMPRHADVFITVTPATVSGRSFHRP